MTPPLLIVAYYLLELFFIRDVANGINGSYHPHRVRVDAYTHTNVFTHNLFDNPREKLRIQVLRFCL